MGGHHDRLKPYPGCKRFSYQRLSDKQLKLKRWEDHFTQLLNRPPATPSLELQQAAVEDSAISSTKPNEEDVAAALNKLKNGKVPGICNITPEMLKGGGSAVVKWLTRLFHAVWIEWKLSSGGLEEGHHLAILQGKR